MPALTIDHLVKSFGSHRALDGMTFHVKPGELYGFVGSNGAGKSTTMRIALGVLSCDSGELRWGDSPITDDLRRRIGYMPEERGLYAKEKIADQLCFLGRLHGMSGAAAGRSANELLDRLGLGERKNDPLQSLSLGNQQRVQLAASLIHDPELLILDEPFSGLDPVAVQVMSELLRERAAAGVPVLFSSHQLDLVQRICDRIGVVAHGAMRAEGTVHELRSAGAIRYAIETPARGWYPAGTHVVEEMPGGQNGEPDRGGTLLLEVDSTERDQDILSAALAAGPVHSFTRYLPDLADLFRGIVEDESTRTSTPAETATTTQQAHTTTEAQA